MRTVYIIHLTSRKIWLEYADRNKDEADLTITPNADKELDTAENGTPVSSKSSKGRYMTATESAKAKFRSRNSSKNLRGEDDESPAKQQKRLSYGSPKPSSPGGTPRAKSITQVKSTT